MERYFGEGPNTHHAVTFLQQALVTTPNSVAASGFSRSVPVSRLQEEMPRLAGVGGTRGSSWRGSSLVSWLSPCFGRQGHNPLEQDPAGPSILCTCCRPRGDPHPRDRPHSDLSSPGLKPRVTAPSVSQAGPALLKQKENPPSPHTAGLRELGLRGAGLSPCRAFLLSSVAGKPVATGCSPQLSPLFRYFPRCFPVPTGPTSHLSPLAPYPHRCPHPVLKELVSHTQGSGDMSFTSWVRITNLLQS